MSKLSVCVLLQFVFENVIVLLCPFHAGCNARSVQNYFVESDQAAFKINFHCFEQFNEAVAAHLRSLWASAAKRTERRNIARPSGVLMNRKTKQ